jgi:hypothetical protein
MSPVKYELGFYIPEGDILHSHRRENFKSYDVSTVRTIAIRDYRHGTESLLRT